ncbi:sigma-54-dependent transcriptional regulator [Denitratisoma oestradiolicum]|uniref:Transcriptional regulator n=1 Tax=Denitratisoma oestradiolicum TaxID=311182 RepID=A0A6S6XXL9_9PROT|nr:response regulator [Denitratisoma oestradiolicum]TWO81813.1 transcriptional regulator [Denitratisoma oestradiolicum]CAB1370779.1 Transcriptional regulator [Denitratisoma oestradiolicum]
MAKVLVVDDEVGIRELLSEILRDEGHDVLLAENAAAARSHRDKLRPDLVLLDIWMPDTDGVTLLKEWAANGQLTMPVVMMSGHATIDTAVEATRIGAMDFLEKPIGMQKLLASVAAALDHGRRPTSRSLSLSAFTRSPALRDVKKRLDQVAAGNRAVLLRSAPGGFVELVARTLQGTNRAWIDLGHDSHALSQDELEQATGGVLYAEELARLTRLQQKNLLFAIERLDKHNLKLVAGTEASATTLAAHGWDEPLLARTFPGRLGLPALVEVRDDLPDMAAHLLTQMVENEEVPARRLSAGALNSLRQHRWAGGYAELRATVRSLALAALAEEVEADEVIQMIGHDEAPPHLKDGFFAELLELPLREAREIFERRYFEHHLAQDGPQMTRLAEKTGLERTHLYRKLKDLGLR